jgi:lysophospholipase L1-like esterase
MMVNRVHRCKDSNRSSRDRDMLHLAILISAVALAPGLQAADETATTDLPKVVIVGDSIRLSYAPTVVKQLAGVAIVISPKANGGDSSNVLKHLDQWVINEKPAIVHFNCGIHDTKKFKSMGKFQVPPEQYAANLRKIVERIRTETDAVVLFATTTPIVDDRAAQTRRDRDYELLDASVCQYNAIAKKVMQELEVPINDLHSTLSNPERATKAEGLIGSDGVHLKSEAKELLGKAVAAFIGSHLPSR